MEIERKFLLNGLPKGYEKFPNRVIEQGYLNVDPVIRIRKRDESYSITYKGSGLLAREEYNHFLDKESYEHLIKKADGNIITKRRFRIPFGQYTIELDIFHGIFEGIILAEIEFPTIEEAKRFSAPEWFGEEVTYDGRYHNSFMSTVEPFDNMIIGGRFSDELKK